ncbi:sensor domain-containing diguanylate cyclase [Fusibacter tunisiensis]|uniref:Histidinol-phosphatase (PHP family) n=1 Tax=Fusibacter tunisiensis TaxID=1008308 RepID=A0ABS2MPR4_9FIRM|nr:sensor domain-containing diguanylate cyclase [Fusibacter tunisiensis]MBM7561399.1 histidinol-phosphatase (PHP family) [Fusibacter tunisiensis]
MADNYLKKELYDRMRNEEDIFNFIQEGALDGIWYWDLENPENEWMSEKFWTTLGYDPKSKLHKSEEWQDLINAEDLKIATEQLKAHLEDPSNLYDQIVRYTHQNGSTIWIRCRGMAIRDENGKPVRMIGAHTEVTEMVEARQKLKLLSEEYEILFNGTQDAIFLVKVEPNEVFRFLQNNLAHQKMTGLKLEDILGKTPQELLGQEMGDKIADNYRCCLKQNKLVDYEETLDLPGGTRIWHTTLNPIFENKKIKYIVGLSREITQQKEIEKTLERHANYDELTALPNRRLFFDRLERIFQESIRDEEVFALLFLDLDGFKLINDTYGHKVGDQVLIETGNRLKAAVRKSDTVARMGGDEFTVILRDVKDIKSTGTIVQKIYDALKVEMEFGEVVCRVNSSIGVAVYPIDGGNSIDLMKNADASMYEIKRTRKGKGGIKFFSFATGDGGKTDINSI